MKLIIAIIQDADCLLYTSHNRLDVSTGYRKQPRYEFPASGGICIRRCKRYFFMEILRRISNGSEKLCLQR